MNTYCTKISESLHDSEMNEVVKVVCLQLEALSELAKESGDIAKAASATAKMLKDIATDGN